MDAYTHRDTHTHTPTHTRTYTYTHTPTHTYTQAEPEAVAKLPANPDRSQAFVDVSMTLQPSKSAVKLGPMELLLPLAV